MQTAYSAANYMPATLKTNKSGWIIEYYVENPQTQMLARKKVKLQRLLMRYSSKTEAKRHINNIVVALNMRLSTGWNPYFVDEDSRMYTPIKEVTKKYLEEIKRNIRPDSCRLYTSFLNIFCDWLDKVSPNIYSSMVTHTLVAKFMDYVYNDRKGRKSGIDPLSVQQLADHHSLEMTTIYAKHLDPNLQKIIVENAPRFS